MEVNNGGQGSSVREIEEMERFEVGGVRGWEWGYGVYNFILFLV